jgi:PASTA domain
MRFTVITALTALTALTAAGCGAAAPSAPATPATPTVTAAAPATSALPGVSSAPARPRVKLIKIPAVVGKNHQLAQDTMQAAGLFRLREEDATGQGRLLIWDRNWVVVRQTPPAGHRVRPETVITLFSKKIGE